MKVEKIYLYENRTDVSLTTYVLDDSTEMLAGKTRPAIIICPGGAYLSCSDREAEPVALRFASMGYHTFVLRYSTYGGGNDFPDLSKSLEPKPECQYPMNMREIGQAMLIVRDHAKEWLVDTDRIAICGFSAGAHNCAMYETNWFKPVMTEYFNRPAEDFRPAAVILGYTLSDYVFMKDATIGDPGAMAMFAASNTAFLGAVEVSDERLAEVSPARNVTELTPPTFLWATSEDNLVPVQHSIRMAHALADKGIPFELHIFEKGAHGLSLSTQAVAQAKSQVKPDVAKWVELVDEWLLKRFTFDLPELTMIEEMIAAGKL